ncbi:hypothetical protein HBI56_206870 [Parastagonospora nodorum]|uniref:Uncharacterized protein n=1 Tax=Phaeosphaeria nodorum (strain SN15 / ATCC MYA-4574 / FGSC 10173) TaxID=321614 RepID=A0A7U2I8Y2_PHANO|nr:hypothetical protein HBH56_218130 [Parastagonospora nodorum]QRD05424.1 hypothetical protein JI435_422440 [Parastagonospora nodorum SN15]KAH3922754.1 hypothetical protein HBH54_219990 [Parastagonospora nodorum]KAH3941238.1 hypothetical protein HBH53_205600 [Parastagonospora nodorum]KAH3958075.1 hypothetical protein HBH51_213900 [Parastagonospora nodorum]
MAGPASLAASSISCHDRSGCRLRRERALMRFGKRMRHHGCQLAWHLVTGNQAPAIHKLSVLKIIPNCGSKRASESYKRITPLMGERGRSMLSFPCGLVESCSKASTPDANHARYPTPHR